MYTKSTYDEVCHVLRSTHDKAWTSREYGWRRELQLFEFNNLDDIGRKNVVAAYVASRMNATHQNFVTLIKYLIQSTMLMKRPNTRKLKRPTLLFNWNTVTFQEKWLPLLLRCVQLVPKTKVSRQECLSGNLLCRILSTIEDKSTLSICSPAVMDLTSGSYTIKITWQSFLTYEL